MKSELISNFQFDSEALKRQTGGWSFSWFVYWKSLGTSFPGTTKEVFLKELPQNFSQPYCYYFSVTKPNNFFLILCTFLLDFFLSSRVDIFIENMKDENYFDKNTLRLETTIMYLILQLNQCDSTAWSGYSFGLSIIILFTHQQKTT